MAFVNSTDVNYDTLAIEFLHSGNWIELQKLVDQDRTSTSSGERKINESEEKDILSSSTGNGISKIQNDGGW